jgi:hypothetical protein
MSEADNLAKLLDKIQNNLGNRNISEMDVTYLKSFKKYSGFKMII